MTQRNRHTIPVFLAQITTLSVFSLLLGMTSPGISWGESALLTTRGWQLGSAHPPGYGGFLHLIHLAQHVLPLGDIAFRANIMGILIMAAASGLILLFMHSLKTPPVLALPHSITFAISLPVLSAVTSAEVYSLHLLLFLGIILILSRHSPRIPSIYSAAFLIGVAATHHLTFLILSPGILWLLATQLRHTKHRLRTASIAVTLLLFGLSAWIAFPIRESVAPAIVWGDASTIDGFMTLITAAEETRGSMRSGLSTISGILHRSRNLGSLLMSTLTLPGLLLAIPGVFTCIKFHRRLTLALCLSGFLLAGSVVIYHSNESASFFLPGLLIVSVFSITGITDIVRRLDQSRLRAVRLIRWPMLLLPCLWMCALIPRAVTASPGESRVAERLARYRIDSGGAGATVVSRRSDTCFQLWYMTEIELRGYPDVVFQHLLSFPWYARDLVLRGLMPERILTYPFEDSRSWNAAATAALIMTRRLSRPIVILDPEILDDLVYAGFTLENPGCLPFGACLGPPNRIGVHYPIAFDPGMPMDLLSAQQMITEYIRQARFFELCGEPHRAHACRDAAMAIDRFGRQNEWWGS